MIITISHSFFFFSPVFVKLGGVKIRGPNLNLIFSVKEVKTLLKFFQLIIKAKEETYGDKIQKLSIIFVK